MDILIPAGDTPEYLKENNLTHDVFMTEDNIRIHYLLVIQAARRLKG